MKSRISALWPYFLVGLSILGIFFSQSKKFLDDKFGLKVLSTRLSSPETAPEWFNQLRSACDRDFQSSDCAQRFQKMIDEKLLWGDVNENLRAGDAAWPDSEIQINFLKDGEEEGRFFIELSGMEAVPNLNLSSKRSSLPEILITFNHELVHYAHSGELRKLIPRRKKLVDHCISPYELSVLRDEKAAFDSEIKFWRKSPDWFKAFLGPLHFDSKFTGQKQITYAEHYKILGERIGQDINFAPKRYVELGLYPACAANLIH